MSAAILRPPKSAAWKPPQGAALNHAGAFPDLTFAADTWFLWPLVCSWDPLRLHSSSVSSLSVDTVTKLPYLTPCTAPHASWPWYFNLHFSVWTGVHIAILNSNTQGSRCAILSLVSVTLWGAMGAGKEDRNSCNVEYYNEEMAGHPCETKCGLFIFFLFQMLRIWCISFDQQFYSTEIWSLNPPLS